MLDNFENFDAILGLGADPVAAANARILAATFRGTSPQQENEAARKNAAGIDRELDAIAAKEDKDGFDELLKFIATLGA